MFNEFWVATGNKGKLTEYKMLLEKEFPDMKIHHQGELPTFSPRPEDGKTFEDNARIKARTLKAVKQGVWVLGEDSGLEVEGMNNLPGIHSARYAGPKASDSENVAKLLKMMALKPLKNRNARFYCSTVVFTPSGEEWVVTGEMKGTIALKPAGLHGFGYDPVFIPEGQTQTLAELGAGYKNQHSHRANALRALIEKMKAL
ncbi:RdgB/HAM1 family non-canonical purine NTP pyrophosphatase [Bdellovibrio sp. HCB2-146]|uniref:RdgB/HAM1 family non-canonical purine NTP pyrophosphatase n=1 Tax=Bdellovibrio sp. HCB2-146 TaxID=3394362 RepID=UPI0039BCF430